MSKTYREQDIDFILARIVNTTNSAEGTILPPKQIGNIRVPIVTNLRILRTQQYFGSTQFTLAWDEPTRSTQQLAHYNVYVFGLLSNNTQPIGPYTAVKSPAEVRVVSRTSVPVTFVVQTVLKSGQISDITSSPSVSAFTSAGSLTASDYPDGSIPITALTNGVDGQLITWDSSGIITTIGPGTLDNILVGGGAGAVPLFKSRATLNLVEGRSNITTANRVVLVNSSGTIKQASFLDTAVVLGATALTTVNKVPKITSAGTLGESGIEDTGTLIKVPSRSISIQHTSPTAYLHIGAGTASANTAPLKIEPGTVLTTPEDGTVEYDGKRFFLTPKTTRRTIELLGDSLTSTQTVANTITETTVFTESIPANSTQVGSLFKVRSTGHYSTANAADSFTIRWKVGGTTIITASSTPASVTNAPIDSEFIFTIRSLGATGTLIGYSKIGLNNLDTSVANTSTTTIDTTGALTIEITIQWDNALAGNTASITQSFLELKP